MKLFLVFSSAMILAGGILGSPSRAADPTPTEIENASKRADAVSELVFAAELVAYGRGEKVPGFKSPEALVTAGGILLQSNKCFGGKVDNLDVKLTDQKGKAIKSDAEKTKSLEAQAAELFDEARTMVAVKKDKAWSAALEALIARTETEAGKDVRGAVGGAKRFTRSLNPGQTHVFTVEFFTGQQAIVGLTSSGSNLQFDILNPSGVSLFNIRGQNARYSWSPGRGAPTGRFTITVMNIGKNVSNYTVTTN